MIHKIGTKIWELVRSATALVAVFGFLATLAVTITIGSMINDDDHGRRSRSSSPS
jgi:hypothetical protein